MCYLFDNSYHKKVLEERKDKGTKLSFFSIFFDVALITKSKYFICDENWSNIFIFPYLLNWKTNFWAFEKVLFEINIEQPNDKRGKITPFTAPPAPIINIEYFLFIKFNRIKSDNNPIPSVLSPKIHVSSIFFNVLTDWAILALSVNLLEKR